MSKAKQPTEPGVTPSGSVLSSSNWTKLRFDQRLAESPCCYELQVLTFCRRKQAGLNHDHGHAWIRLVKPDGRYSSLGFYPDESMGVEPEKLPGLRIPGVLLQPDKYDQLTKNVLQSCIVLSELDFYKLTTLLECQQTASQTSGLNFDLVESNCVGFIENTCRSVGVEVKSRVRFLCFFRAYTIGRYLVPKPVGAWFFNLSLLFLGGLRCEPSRWVVRSGNVTELVDQTDIRPLFQSVREALFGRPILFYHVRGLQTWQKQLESHRVLAMLQRS